MKTNNLKTIIVIILIPLIVATNLCFSLACKKELILSETELTFLNLVNETRTENNLTPLIPDQKLMDLAESRNKDMVARNYFSHWTPEGKRIKYGEILGRSRIGIIPERYTKAWLNSQTHREVILNPGYKKIGININDNKDKRIVTILFSSRRW